MKIYIAAHHELVREVAESLNFTITDNPLHSNIHWKIERLRDAIQNNDIPQIPTKPRPSSASNSNSTSFSRPSSATSTSKRRRKRSRPSSASSRRNKTRPSVITGLGQAVTKDALTSSLEAFNILLGKSTRRIIPKTFCLPSQLKQFEAHLDRHRSSNNHYIYKPSTGSQGKGIHLFNSAAGGWNEIRSKITITSTPESGRHDYVEKSIPRSVVQKYVANPYLKLGGLKFDFRLYVLVESLDPLKIWLCDEGLVRFCTVPYHKPTKSNSKDMCQHLSNYSINKKNSIGYVHSSILNPDPSAKSTGTKRTLTSVLQEMRDMNEDVDTMMKDIKDLVIQTSAALQSEIILRGKSSNSSNNTSNTNKNDESKYESKHESKHQHQVEKTEENKTQEQKYSAEEETTKPFQPNKVIDGFQVLGFDVMIDENLRPYLLEVNANPSMRTDYTTKDDQGDLITLESPVDKHIKSIVVKGALLIISNKNQDNEYKDDVLYTNLHANEANFVRRATWITSRVRRFYERLCRGRNGLPCNIFCRSLRSILRLRGALIHSPSKASSMHSLNSTLHSTKKTSPYKKYNRKFKVQTSDTWLKPSKRKGKKNNRKQRERSGSIDFGSKLEPILKTSSSPRTSPRLRPSSSASRRPVSAGRSRKQTQGFEAGRLFLLFAQCVGERMTKGYTTLDTTMSFCQFVPALVILARQQYSDCPDAVTALDTLLAEAEEAERGARQTLMTSVTTKSHSLGHLIILKDMMENTKRRERAKLLNQELDSKLIEERRAMTRKRQEIKRKETEAHLERRKRHEKQRRKIKKKEKEGLEEKKRRQAEFKKWLKSGGT